VTALINFRGDGCDIKNGDIGTVIGPCDNDRLLDSNRRVLVDFGRYGKLNVVVTPACEAHVRQVPRAVPVSASATATSVAAIPRATVLPSQRHLTSDSPVTAAPADTRPHQEDRKSTNPDAVGSKPMNVHRIACCDRCGERFADSKAIEKHHDDRRSNMGSSACAKNQHSPRDAAELPAAGKPSQYDAKAWLDVLTPNTKGGAATHCFSSPEASIIVVGEDDFKLSEFQPHDRASSEKVSYLNGQQVKEYLLCAARRGINVEKRIFNCLR